MATRTRLLATTLLACLQSLACASRRDAGAALVASGTAVAVVGAAAATQHTTCSFAGCVRSTSRHGAAAAAAVGAGVALAAAGAAVATDAHEETTHRAARSHVAPSNGWRLIRKPSENAGDGEPLPD